MNKTLTEQEARKAARRIRRDRDARKALRHATRRTYRQEATR